MQTEWLEIAFIAFCRIGCCLMVAAGFASVRVPAPVRLCVAIAITAAALPLLEADIRAAGVGKGSFELARVAVGEGIIGVALGLVTRLFLLAIDFSATFVGTLCGLAMTPTPGVESGDPSTVLGDFVSLTALAVVFASGLHLVSVQALFDSYVVMPAAQPLNHAASLRDLVKSLTAAFQVALQFAAPFILLSGLSNLILGLATRMLPQVPMQFVVGPALAVGGVALLGLLLPVMMMRLVTTMSESITR